jgi:hypothetical protein
MHWKRKVQANRFRCIGCYAEGSRANNEPRTKRRGFREKYDRREGDVKIGYFAIHAYPGLWDQSLKRRR